MITKNLTTTLFLPLTFSILSAISSLTHAESISMAPATTLDELLTRVTQDQHSESLNHKKRIAHFQHEKNQQAKLLETLENNIKNLESTGEGLKDSIKYNNDNLKNLEEDLSKAIGNFGELFGVTRQVAAETRSQIENSIISAQFVNREQILTNIANNKSLPTLEELKQLWIVLLQEQTEQGKISRFNTQVDDENGISHDQEVIRLGAFTAVSNNKFVTWSNEAKRLSTLSRQPSSTYTSTAKLLTNSQPDQLIQATIDPSRGTILGLLVQTPNLLERFKQGGLPGYVVSVLAIIGLTIGFFRLISLWLTTLKVNKQIKSKKIDLRNPLGRVLNAYESNPTADTETLELKLNDAVLKEIPTLDRGLNLLKVLAAVAPLMGLLGTVVGMIVTFQAITLWGAGEPKLMAGGISQALVTTVQGLVAAIPLLLLHSIANGRARLVQQVLEEQSAGLIANRAETLSIKSTVRAAL